MSRIILRNSTDLCADRLMDLFREGVRGWSTGTVDLRVRYSRGADFSGACYYRGQRVFINLGRHLRYPYHMPTHLARARVIGRRWRREIYTVELADGYQVVLFIFMHELFHLLIKRARRNRRQKEGMCDRFAARHLVNRFACPVRDSAGNPAPREEWDFRDLDGFVAGARAGQTPTQSVSLSAARRHRNGETALNEQLWLFPV